jgi:ATP-dependent protease HslVU (ClpYQ) peptidase subunit
LTCIVGLVEDGTVYLGGDSAVSTAHGKLIKAQPKVYKRGDFVIGGAGSSIIIQAMSHITTLPPCYENQDPLEYIINTFMPCFRSAVREVGQMAVENGIESMENYFLIGFKGHLFRIGSKFDVLESIDDMMSIGSGAYHALGALYVIDKLNIDIDPEDKIKIALESAAKYDEYVSEPFTIESMSKAKSGIIDVDKIFDRANEMMDEEEHD